MEPIANFTVRDQAPSITRHLVNDHDPTRVDQTIVSLSDKTGSATRKTSHHHQHHNVRSGRAKGGVLIPFPEKLHDMLTKAKPQRFDHIVSWQPHGRSFIVHQPELFVQQVMPRFFKQSKLRSFQRQLNLYGFSRLTKGPDRGGYYHEMFLRGRMHLCQRMFRVRVKGDSANAKVSPSKDPNLYNMEPCLEDSGHHNQAAIRKPTFSNQNIVWCENSSFVDTFEIFFPFETNRKASDSSNDDEDSSESWEHFTLRTMAPSHVSYDEADTTSCLLSSSSRSSNSCEGIANEFTFQSGEAMMFEGKRFHYLDVDLCRSMHGQVPWHRHHNLHGVGSNNFIENDLLLDR